MKKLRDSERMVATVKNVRSSVPLRVLKMTRGLKKVTFRTVTVVMTSVKLSMKIIGDVTRRNFTLQCWIVE